MYNSRQQAFAKFDANLYNFEKKRQIVDNKAKEKEKSEKFEKFDKDKINDNIKNKNNINKIQINFQNSFVNEQTHQKYDKIIENNIKRNNEKIDRIIEKEFIQIINEENIGQDKIMVDNLTRNNLDSINETHNEDANNTKTNNDSEMILIESVSYLKNRLTDFSKLNETDFPYLEKEDKLNLLNIKYEPTAKVDETANYESDKEGTENNHETIIDKDNEETLIDIDETLKDRDETLIDKNAEKEIDPYKDLTIRENHVNNFKPNTDHEKIIIEKDNKNYDIEEVIEEVIYQNLDIPNNLMIVNQNILDIESTYDKFLEDSLNLVNNDIHKNNLQIILKNQMKSIISNIKERKKDKKIIKGERKKLVLENIIKAKYKITDELKKEQVVSVNDEDVNYENELCNNEDIKINIRNELRNILVKKEKIDLNMNFNEEKNRIDLNKDMNKMDLNEDRYKIDLNEDHNEGVYFEDFVNIKDDLINYKNEELDDNEVTLIHHSIHMEEKLNKPTRCDSDDQEKDIIVHNKIDLNEFIKDNTNPHIELNEDITNFFEKSNNEHIFNEELKYQEIEPYREKNTNDNINNNRLLIFDNFEDTNEFEEKKKKLEKIREKKLSELERKKEKSRPKTSNQAKIKSELDCNNVNLNKQNDKVTNKSNDRRSEGTDRNEKINNKREKVNEKNYNASANVNINSNSNSNQMSNQVNRSKSPVNRNIKKSLSNIVDTSNNSDLSRIPIKITREESQIANKKIKNINYTKLSNKKTIKSAISTVCLAGEPNRSCREKILDIIQKCPCENFVILFKGNFGRFDLKAIYTFNNQTNRTELLTCLTNSPIVIESHMVTNYFKYDLIQKDFKLLKDNKEISVIVDGVSLVSNR